MADDRIGIGTVKAVNPARRELRVTVEPGHANEFEEMKWIRVAIPGEAEVRPKVKSIRNDGDVLLIELAAGTPRDLVAKMRMAKVVISVGERQAKAGNGRSVAEFLGMQVRTINGEILGSISGAMETPANDVIEIETRDGRTLLAPVIDQVIVAVDWEARTITVDNLDAHAVDSDEETV